jgi:hypothetical protein
MIVPKIAISVRQPWAWAIVASHKDIENRSTFAVTKAGFDPRPVAIHAAKGMTRDEYEFAFHFMDELGVLCPPPDELVRGAIIGAATITAVVERSDSRWFMGPRGLVLVDRRRVDPIPAIGALGCFEWQPDGTLAEPARWMRSWPEKGR